LANWFNFHSRIVLNRYYYSPSLLKWKSYWSSFWYYWSSYMLQNQSQMSGVQIGLLFRNYLQIQYYHYTTQFNHKANPMLLLSASEKCAFLISPFSAHSVEELYILLFEVSKYIPLYSCCCQKWPEKSLKGRFDTWYICNRLSLPNPSLCLPITQPRQIDLRMRNSGGRHLWLGY